MCWFSLKWKEELSVRVYFALRAGIFRALGSFDPMRIWEAVQEAVPALPSIVSMSPLGYPSAWLHPEPDSVSRRSHCSSVTPDVADFGGKASLAEPPLVAPSYSCLLIQWVFAVLAFCKLAWYGTNLQLQMGRLLASACKSSARTRTTSVRLGHYLLATPPGSVWDGRPAPVLQIRHSIGFFPSMTLPLK